MTMSAFETTKRTADVDGLTFSYHEAGAGDTLVLLHGSGPGVSAWSNFRGNIPVFAEGFHVLAPDLPGFGGTDLPPIDEFYPTLAARRVLDLLDALGAGDVFVIGNSMGGAVAAELASIAPDRVRRMAIMGSGGLSVGLFSAEPSEGLRRLLEFVGDPTRDRLVAWIETMVHDRALITEELIEERWTNAHAPGALERSRAVFGAMLDPALQEKRVPLWTKASSFSTPTLLLWGRDDRTLPYDQAHYAMRHLPDVELHAFSGCGHWVQVERKAEFERLTTEFFTRTPR